MAISANGQPESGRIVFAGSDFPHPVPDRMLSSAPEVSLIITVGSESGPFLDFWPGSDINALSLIRLA